MFNRVLNKAMNCYHISPVLCLFIIYSQKSHIFLRKMFPAQQICIRQVNSSAKFFFNSCAEMLSSSADAVQSQSTLCLKEIICLRFVYKILAMVLRYSVNDVKCSNVIVSKFRNEVVSRELTAKLIANRRQAQFK